MASGYQWNLLPTPDSRLPTRDSPLRREPRHRQVDRRPLAGAGGGGGDRAVVHFGAGAASPSIATVTGAGAGEYFRAFAIRLLKICASRSTSQRPVVSRPGATTSRTRPLSGPDSAITPSTIAARSPLVRLRTKPPSAA